MGGWCFQVWPVLLLILPMSCENGKKTSRETWKPVQRISGLENVIIPSGNRFYVDPVLGDDANDGTLDSPW